MTYEQFLDLERSKALAVIKEERRRFRAAQELFDVYAAGMADLKLQSLTWGDIGGRLTELDIAERELDEDYSDTELNRARFAHTQTDAPDIAGLVSGGGR